MYAWSQWRRVIVGFCCIYNFSPFFFRVIVKFIVGDEPCPVPPNDRLDQYSCQPELEFNPGICANLLSPRRNNNQCNDNFFYNYVKKLLQSVTTQHARKEWYYQLCNFSVIRFIPGNHITPRFKLNINHNSLILQCWTM